MVSQDDAIILIRKKGPVIPTNIAKDIGQNILFTSAILSELVSRGTLKISQSTRIGGSPLYYLQGQEYRLQEFSKHLNEKERRAYDRLQLQKVLRDSEQEPIFRVALRAIKDFAVPLAVTLGSEKILFWKWYLLQKEEAERLIKSKLGVVAAGQVKEKPAEELPKAKPEERKEPKKERPPKKVEEKKPEKPKEEQKTLKPEPRSAFIDEAAGYFRKNNIQVIEQLIIRKDSELDFVVAIPTTVGNLHYFCKAKSKSRINDGDLSSAFIQAQSRKLPALFLGKGELTKKALALLQKEFKGMAFKRI